MLRPLTRLLDKVLERRWWLIERQRLSAHGLRRGRASGGRSSIACGREDLLEEMLERLSSQQNDLAGAIEAAAAAQNACEERLIKDQSALVSKNQMPRTSARSRLSLRTTWLDRAAHRTDADRLCRSAGRRRRSAPGRHMYPILSRRRTESRDLTSEDQKLVDTLAEITETQAELRGKIEAAKQNIATARTALKDAEDSVREGFVTPAKRLRHSGWTSSVSLTKSRPRLPRFRSSTRRALPNQRHGVVG